MTTHVSGHSDLRSAGGWRCWRCWRAPGSREPPSPLSAALRANNISSSAPRSPSCAARSRCEGRRSTRQPGSLFPSEPPWLACPGWRLAALGNFGSPCRTSFRRGCKKSSVLPGRYSQQSCVLLFIYFYIKYAVSLYRKGLWENSPAAVSQAALCYMTRPHRCIYIHYMPMYVASMSRPLYETTHPLSDFFF